MVIKKFDQVCQAFYKKNKLPNSPMAEIPAAAQAVAADNAK